MVIFPLIQDKSCRSILGSFEGASLYLGIPMSVALPYSILDRTSAWSAILKSAIGRKGLVYLSKFNWKLAALVVELMWFCMVKDLSNVMPRDFVT